MIPGSEVMKHIRWGINNFRKYRDSEYYKITPRFILSELVSKTNRIEHYEKYSLYEEQRRLEMLTPEERADINAAKDFAKSELYGTRDLGRFPLMDYALSCVGIDGVWAEFGVYRGESINHIASSGGHPVHGFDSFMGLPEDWNSYLKKGLFNLKSRLPRVENNVKLHVGLFSDTLPGFKSEIGDSPIAFLHVDCDLYSSTVDIFRHLEENIVPGTVILFDEFYNYPGWPKHEFRAFNEFISSTGKSYQYIGYNSNAEQVALIIL